MWYRTMTSFCTRQTNQINRAVQNPCYASKKIWIHRAVQNLYYTSKKIRIHRAVQNHAMLLHAEKDSDTSCGTESMRRLWNPCDASESNEWFGYTMRFKTDNVLLHVTNASDTPCNTAPMVCLCMWRMNRTQKVMESWHIIISVCKHQAKVLKCNSGLREQAVEMKADESNLACANSHRLRAGSRSDTRRCRKLKRHFLHARRHELIRGPAAECSQILQCVSVRARHTSKVSVHNLHGRLWTPSGSLTWTEQLSVRSSLYQFASCVTWIHSLQFPVPL